MALLEKLLCCPAGLSDFVPQLLRNPRAREKVRTSTLSQISATMRTGKRANAEWFGNKFALPEALATCSALGDAVVPAIHVQENMHFRAQMARPAAIDMRHTIAVRLDGLVR